MNPRTIKWLFAKKPSKEVGDTLKETARIIKDFGNLNYITQMEGKLEALDDLSPCCGAWDYGDYKICSVCGENC